MKHIFCAQLFVDAHDESAEIERAIMEAAGVDDNTDKIVESIQARFFVHSSHIEIHSNLIWDSLSLN